jgi:hypothetical protein
MNSTRSLLALAMLAPSASCVVAAPSTAKKPAEVLGTTPLSGYEGRLAQTFTLVQQLPLSCMKYVDERTVCAQTGDPVFAPRGLMHTWHCASEGGGRLLVLVTPGENFERFALQMSENRIVPNDAESMAKLMTLCESHGLIMLLPAA